jgi:predicted nucleotidyltransferase
MPTDYMNLFATLNASGIRYVVIGGLATVLYGVDRLTADVDVIFDLASKSTAAAIDALTRSGYRPLAPVDATDLADAATRSGWQRNHGMVVFSLWDSGNRRPTLDILLDSTVPFADLWRDAVDMSFRGVTIKVASISHLIQLKQHSGRPQDLTDIARLQQIAKTRQQP